MSQFTNQIALLIPLATDFNISFIASPIRGHMFENAIPIFSENTENNAQAFFTNWLIYPPAWLK